MINKEQYEILLKRKKELKERSWVVGLPFTISGVYFLYLGIKATFFDSRISILSIFFGLFVILVLYFILAAFKLTPLQIKKETYDINFQLAGYKEDKTTKNDTK